MTNVFLTVSHELDEEVREPGEHLRVAGEALRY